MIAALGGSIYYGEARRREKKEESLKREKTVRDKEFQTSMKLAEQAHASSTSS